MQWLRTANAAAARRPLLTSTIVTGTKAVAADALIQLHVEKREHLDLRRTALFGSFGCLYQGHFQYWTYNKLFERLFPGTGSRAVLMKVAVTNFICDPVFFFPVFYSFREILHVDEKRGVGPWCAVDGLREYSKHWKEDLTNSWAIWFPTHAVTYGVLPIHLRMPWIAAVSFGYVSLLSFLRGNKHEQQEQVEAPAMTLRQPLPNRPLLSMNTPAHMEGADSTERTR